MSNTEVDAGGEEDLPGSPAVLVEGVGCAWLMLEPKEHLWGCSETERVLGARGGAAKSTGPFSRAAGVVMKGLVTYGALAGHEAALSTSCY